MNLKVLGLAVLCLVGGALIGFPLPYLQIDTLQSRVSSLQSTIASLQLDQGALNTTYHQLLANHDALEGEYGHLLDLYSDLQSKAACSVDVLIDQQYYQFLKPDLRKAHTSIQVAMYSMLYDPYDSFDWANDLIDELVSAHNRGVHVTVVIEYNEYFPPNRAANEAAYNYLSTNNVAVQLNQESTTDHLKLLVIDHQFVYIGSHNWSESALYYNHETSVRIVSAEIAEIFETYLQTTYGI